jgi:lactoylglutathione lyase
MPVEPEVSEMSQESAAGVVGIHTVGIPVNDQDEAIDFYVGVLGLDKRIDVPMGGDRRWIEVAPPGSSTSIALVPATESDPTGKETGVRLVASDAEAAHNHLSGSGVDAGEILRWPGVPAMFAFRDMDGNGLEMIEVSGS